MSQTTPTPITPPAPSAASVAAVDPKDRWYQRRTTWAAITAVTVALGAIAVIWASPMSLPEKISGTSSAVASMLAALAGVFARQGATSAAAVVSERLDAHEERTGTG